MPHAVAAPDYIFSCSGLGQSVEEVAARNASLLDQLSDLCRQAALAARKPLLDWLRLLTQVQLTQQDTQGVRQGAQRRAGQGARQQQAQQGSQQEQQWQQERQRLLREVVRLRAQLQVSTWAGEVYGGDTPPYFTDIPPLVQATRKLG